VSRRIIVLALGAILALVVGWQVAAFAAHSEASLAGSNFEIDTDANLKVDDPASSTDWAGVTEIQATDKVNGTGDDSYAGGVKEDTVCPGQTTDSIPPNKSDLLSFHVYREPGSGSHPGFLNLAWSRVSEPSGTTLMDFEFNQSSTNCSSGPNKVRTAGDLLIEYAIDQGGSRADITARRWTGTAWGPTQNLDVPSATCGGQPCAAGTINTSPILAADSDGLITNPPTVQKNARTFGEAQIDLRLIFQPNKCASFGSAMLKSRSSDSFTSQLKDFVAPVGIDLTNCGKVIIHKETNPDTDPTTGPLFNYSKSFGTDPPSTNSFSLRDEGTKTFTNVLFGDNYTVEELLGANLPSGGWEFVSVDCSNNADNPDANVTPDSIVGAVVTFDINDEDDVLECTYTNQQRVSTITTAQSVFPNDSATVTGTLGGTPTGNVTFELYGPGTNCTGTVRYSQTVALTSGSASTTNGDPNNAPADFAINASNEGTYWWKVAYAGDANNPAVTSCVENTAADITNGGPVNSND
jgi:hypothetical protein